MEYVPEKSEADTNHNTVVEGTWDEQFAYHHDALSPDAPRDCRSTQPRRATLRDFEEILECSFEGDDLHSEWQIVTKEDLLDQTLQESLPR